MWGQYYVEMLFR